MKVQPKKSRNINNIFTSGFIEQTSSLDSDFRKNLLNHLFNSNIIGIFIVNNTDGVFVDANDALLKLIGYTRKELIEGKLTRDTVTAPEYEHLSDYAKATLKKGGETATYEKEYIHKSGKRIPVLIAVSKIAGTKDLGIGFVLDITKRKIAEIKQKELDRRKDEFIALASHELKTPLTSIKMYTQLVQKEALQFDNPKAVRLVSSMDKQIDKLTDLVNDLLDVSRIQSGKLLYKKELFSFDNLIQETLEELQRVSPTHILILKGKTNQKISADRDRIKQVFTNLITNAIKYSPKQNKVIITLKKLAHAVQVSVQDFGIGIPQNQRRKIFDRFFQVDRPMSQTYSGLGLGLYITKEIIDRYKGEIWVESKTKIGTTMSFTLPIYKKRAAK